MKSKIVDNKKNYIISHDDTKVEVWANKDVPFEPKEWQKTMKDDIRSALKAFPSSDKKELYTSYYTIENEKYKRDVENILLYNIGSGAFTKICASTMCIERDFCGNLIPQMYQMSHYYKYELVNKSDFVIHKPLKTLAEWDGIILSKISFDKPSFFWNYIKQSIVKVFEKEYSGKYGIEIFIETPRKELNLTSVIKPLLDGIICSFHQQETITDEILENLEFVILTTESESPTLIKQSRLNIPI
jgi:hypothetical protein